MAFTNTALAIFDFIYKYLSCMSIHTSNNTAAANKKLHHKRFMPGTGKKANMDEKGETMIKREVSVKKEEDIEDESCVNVFGEDSVIVKNEEKEFEEENLLVNPELLKEVINFYSIFKFKSFCVK